jgi:hypothetical protein
MGVDIAAPHHKDKKIVHDRPLCTRAVYIRALYAHRRQKGRGTQSQTERNQVVPISGTNTNKSLKLMTNFTFAPC